MSDRFIMRDPCSTYRGPNDKREGGGPHNWGNVGDEAGLVFMLDLLLMVSI